MACAVVLPSGNGTEAEVQSGAPGPHAWVAASRSMTESSWDMQGCARRLESFRSSSCAGRCPRDCEVRENGNCCRTLGVMAGLIMHRESLLGEGMTNGGALRETLDLRASSLAEGSRAKSYFCYLSSNTVRRPSRGLRTSSTSRRDCVAVSAPVCARNVLQSGQERSPGRPFGVHVCAHSPRQAS